MPRQLREVWLSCTTDTGVTVNLPSVQEAASDDEAMGLAVKHVITNGAHFVMNAGTIPIFGRFILAIPFKCLPFERPVEIHTPAGKVHRA